MKEVVIDNIVAFKLVWFRVACYFFVPAGMLFLTQTETYSASTWEDMGTFLHTRLYIACAIAGLTSICAYIDSSFQRARERSSEMKSARQVDDPNQLKLPLHEGQSASTVRTEQSASTAIEGRPMQLP